MAIKTCNKCLNYQGWRENLLGIDASLKGDFNLVVHGPHVAMTTGRANVD